MAKNMFDFKLPFELPTAGISLFMNEDAFGDSNPQVPDNVELAPGGGMDDGEDEW